MPESKELKDLVVEIERIAKATNQRPCELTKATFFQHADERFTEWYIRKLGGLNAVIKAFFPAEELHLTDIEINKRRSAYVKKLEKKYGSWEVFKQNITESLQRQLNQIEVNPMVLDKKATTKYLKESICPSTKHDKEKRSIVTVWSDQHFGTNVDKDELGGKNEFGWVIGARRLGMLCEQIASYKVERRDLHEELVILLLGDNIGGVIHNQEGPDFDLITYQVNGMLSYYIQAIAYLKNFFPKIRVLCQPGNHGRMQHKLSKDRALSQKYDSFENIVFYSLSHKFASDDKVEVTVPKSPYIDAEVQGHRIFATHGDTVFETGNVGKTVNLAKLEHQIHRINAEERDKRRKPFELFATGHVHHPVLTQVGPGVKVVINGCLIGNDSYALGVGIFSSVPVQALWECTKKYAQGDTRLIYVDLADKDTKYEKIITPYKHELAV